MCLAIPAQLKAVSEDGASAEADFGGIVKTIDASLIEDAAPGDWVIVHVGFALGRIDEQAAAETLALLQNADGSIREEAAAEADSKPIQDALQEGRAKTASARRPS